MIDTLVWILPRPRPIIYKGGFPLHFEKKLLRLYGFDEKQVAGKVFHPFGGKSEYGTRADIRTDPNPNLVADAHILPFADETWEFIVFDPPYSDKESAELYNTPPLHIKKCIAESVRVLKTGGYIALYHRLWLPRPDGCTYDKRILVSPGQWHETRTCHVFRKGDFRN